MIPGLEWDLDDEQARPSDGPSGTALFPLLLALALVGLAAGAIVGAMNSSAGQLQVVPSASLLAREPTWSDSGPTVALRLMVDNSGGAPVELARLELDGVGPGRTDTTISRTVAAHTLDSVDVPVQPDCARTGTRRQLRARVRLAAGSSPASLPVFVPTRLARPGGLCMFIDRRIPRGWRSPIDASDVREVDGGDLRMLVGIGRPGPTGGGIGGVWLGDQLLQTANRTTPDGKATELRLHRPPCESRQESGPVPTTVRILTYRGRGLEERSGRVGPELAAWAMNAWEKQRCGSGQGAS
jgi:hypothetical protein